MPRIFSYSNTHAPFTHTNTRASRLHVHAQAPVISSKQILVSNIYVLLLHNDDACEHTCRPRLHFKVRTAYFVVFACCAETRDMRGLAGTKRRRSVVPTRNHLFPTHLLHSADGTIAKGSAAELAVKILNLLTLGLVKLLEGRRIKVKRQRASEFWSLDFVHR